MELDQQAISVGATIGFAVAFPGLVLGGLLDAEAFAVFVYAGLAIAGFVAGSKRPDTPLSHGIVAALVTYLVAALIAIALRVAKGDDLHPAVYVFNAGLAIGFGAFGGYLAERRAARG